MAGTWDYVKAAFNLRPLGMPVPPNWFAVAGFALAGFALPPLWLLGAGLELAYLAGFALNPRFRRVVDAQAGQQDEQDWQRRRDTALARLDASDRRIQAELEARARETVDHLAASGDAGGARDQETGLSRLAWVHLRLLGARQGLKRLVGEAKNDGWEIDEREREITARLASVATADQDPLKPTDPLKESLQGQLTILRERRQRQQDAAQKLTYVESELERLQQQVELLRDQALSAQGGEGAARAIADLGSSLGSTSRWMEDQRQLLGEAEDLFATPPGSLLRQSQPGRVRA